MIVHERYQYGGSDMAETIWRFYLNINVSYSKQNRIKMVQFVFIRVILVFKMKNQTCVFFAFIIDCECSLNDALNHM